jgi:uncharacterized protein (DUF4213/DUF364 family)
MPEMREQSPASNNSLKSIAAVLRLIRPSFQAVRLIKDRDKEKMGIIDNLLTTLNYSCQASDIRVGPFQTAAVSRNCGLASTPHNPGHHDSGAAVKEAGSLLEKDTRTLAALAKSASEMEAAIGMAMINSLLEVDEKLCTEINAADLLMKNGEGKRVVMVGHFPFTERLRRTAGELRVIEKNPRQGDHPESDAKEIIPQADVVGITGTAFINHTIEELLSLCKPQAFVIILGGTAPLSPVLFEYGISAVSGTVVDNPQKVLQGVSQGATFRQLPGKRLLTMTKVSF